MKHSSKETIPIKRQTVGIDPSHACPVSLFMYSVFSRGVQLSPPAIRLAGAPLTTACSELQGVWGGGFWWVWGSWGSLQLACIHRSGLDVHKTVALPDLWAVYSPKLCKVARVDTEFVGKRPETLGYHLGCYFSEHSHVVLLNLC